MASHPDHYWHHYPIGHLGEWCRALTSTAAWVALALAPLMLLIVTLGMIAEEDRIGSMSKAIDDLLRFTALMLMTLGLLAWFTICLTSYLVRRAVSRSLVEAAAADAPPTQVPAPGQVDAVIWPPAKPLAIFGLLVGPLLVLFGVMALAAGDLPGLDWLMTLAGVLLIPLGIASLKRFKHAHHERHQRIAAHWTSEHEESAWSRASISDKSGRRTKRSVWRPDPRRPDHLWEQIATYCTGIGGALALVAFFPFCLGLSTRCSGVAGSSRAGRECHETYYSDPVEQLLGLAWWTFAGAVAIAFVLFVIGLLAHGVADHLNRAFLLTQISDPAAPRPERDLLAAYSNHNAHPVAGALAMLATASIPAGIAVQQLGAGHGLGSQETYAAHQETGLIIAACGLAMLLAAVFLNWHLDVSTWQLRNDLIRRWPVRAPKGKRYRLALEYSARSRGATPPSP